MEQLLEEGRQPQVIEGVAKDITPPRLEVIRREATTPPGYVIPPGPLRQLNIDRLNTKTEVMEQLNSLIPLNKYGLPDYVYRADLIDHGLMLDAMRRLHADPSKQVAVEVQDMLNAAVEHLDYSEAYPSFEGTPFWKQLSYEPTDAHVALQTYIGLTGVRQLSELIAFDQAALREWFYLYMWDFRAKSFDLYKIAHHQRRRIMRALAVEDDHYTMAERLIKGILAKIEQKGSEWLDITEPHQMVNMLEKLAKIQRLSVGLSAMSAQEETIKAPSTATLMELAAGPQSETKDNSNAVTEKILDNPDAIAAAEDLILELNGK